jgi:hypothetical protein
MLGLTSSGFANRRTKIHIAEIKHQTTSKILPKKEQKAIKNLNK